MTTYKTYVGKLANYIGGFGYISTTMQWIWSSIPLLYPLAATKVFQDHIMPAAPTETTTLPTVTNFTMSPILEVIIIGLAIVFSAGAIIYAIAAVPKGFSKAGKAVTAKTADVVIPVITKRQPVSPKYRRTLLERISWGVKALLVFIPVFLLFVATPEDFQLTQDQFVAAGIILAIGSMMLFLFQFVLTKLAKLPNDQIW